MVSLKLASISKDKKKVALKCVFNDQMTWISADEPVSIKPAAVFNAVFLSLFSSSQFLLELCFSCWDVSFDFSFSV